MFGVKSLSMHKHNHVMPTQSRLGFGIEKSDHQFPRYPGTRGDFCKGQSLALKLCQFGNEGLALKIDLSALSHTSTTLILGYMASRMAFLSA